MAQKANRFNYDINSYYAGRKMQNVQTFNDGIASIYIVGNTASPGNMPKDGLTFKLKMNYSEEKLGITRVYLSRQDQSEITKLIRVQRVDSINEHDVVIINGKQYDINLIQDVPEITPKCLDLSLERLEVAYEIE